MVFSEWQHSIIICMVICGGRSQQDDLYMDFSVDGCYHHNYGLLTQPHTQAFQLPAFILQPWLHASRKAGVGRPGYKADKITFGYCPVGPETPCEKPKQAEITPTANKRGNSSNEAGGPSPKVLYTWLISTC